MAEDMTATPSKHCTQKNMKKKKNCAPNKIEFSAKTSKCQGKSNYFEISVPGYLP
jgi:hypothetical protein